jgi:hypothetical protein
VNYVAYRGSISGIGEAPLTLYQNVEEWQLAAGRNVARFERGD